LLYCRKVSKPIYQVVDIKTGAIVLEKVLNYWSNIIFPNLHYSIVHKNYIFIPTWFDKIYILNKITGDYIGEFSTVDTSRRRMILAAYENYIIVHSLINSKNMPLEIFEYEDVL
jgi:hypothetical protein